MTLVDRFTFSSAPTKRIASMQFGTLGPEEIVRCSVAEIDSADSFEKGRPKLGGLAHPRMGTMDRSMPCQT